MPSTHDGPATPNFAPLRINGNFSLTQLAESTGTQPHDITTRAMAAPSGACTCWGIPFKIGRVIVLADKAVTRKVAAVKTHWLLTPPTTGRRS